MTGLWSVLIEYDSEIAAESACLTHQSYFTWESSLETSVENLKSSYHFCVEKVS